ncbi:MAG: hypothetical protein ACP5J4_02750 [Anaerolineae bacterium]
MQTAETIQYRTVVEQVKTWPADERLALVQDILRTLKSQIVTPDRQEGTLGKALGLLTSQYPAPTDNTVQQWLHERRMEKYG